jgi:hypothetical protein
MRIFEVILIVALLLTAVTAEATDKPTIFATVSSHLNIFRPPYPFPIDDFDSPWGSVGLAYDGDYWWVVDFYDTVYQFDYGGDFVSSFTTRAPDPRGLGFDGEYLWISCEEGEFDNVKVYQCGLDGTPGPMGDFPAYGSAGLTFFQGNVLTLTWDNHVNFYNPDGTFIRDLEVLGGGEHHTSAMANDGAYLWINIYWEEPYEDSYIYKIDPETGEYAGEYLWAGGTSFSGLSYADWTYTEIEAESIGKIKAYFANQ